MRNIKTSKQIQKLLKGNFASQKFVVVLVNKTTNLEIMSLINQFAIKSVKSNIPIFFEILNQDYAEKLAVVKNLKKLNCSNKKLTFIPDSIGKLKNLEYLNCCDNQLTSLPESIGELKKLRTLNCSSNQLTDLPESIGQLNDLKWLDCSRNELTSSASEFVSKLGIKNLFLF